MRDIQIPQEALEYLTHCLRHAVSNGEYLTPQMLEQALAEFTATHPEQNIKVLH